MIKVLLDAYENFGAVFPRPPRHFDKEHDLYAELDMADDAVRGPTLTLLDGEKPRKREWLLVNEGLNERLEAAKPQDPEALKEWQAMKSYKQELDKLAKVALAYYDQKYGKA
jgi:hypothetical protein